MDGESGESGRSVDGDGESGGSMNSDSGVSRQRTVRVVIVEVRVDSESGDSGW